MDSVLYKSSSRLEWDALQRCPCVGLLLRSFYSTRMLRQSAAYSSCRSAITPQRHANCYKESMTEPNHLAPRDLRALSIASITRCPILWPLLPSRLPFHKRRSYPPLPLPALLRRRLGSIARPLHAHHHTRYTARRAVDMMTRRLRRCEER